MDVEGKKADRFSFLCKLYEKTGGDESKIEESSEIGKQLGIEGDAIDQIVQYLSEESLIDVISESGEIIRITHYGVKGAEAAILKSEKRMEAQQASSVTSQVESINELRHNGITIIWNPLRSLLEQKFNFGEIKDIVGLAGMDLTKLARLQQMSGGGSSKSQLMTGIDGVFGEMNSANINRFLRIATEEVLKRKPELEEKLLDYLSRLGWTLCDGIIIPIELLDVTEFPEIPESAHTDFVKAATRFRDGDLSGALSSACGAVDSVTARVYSSKELGDPSEASFQERVNKSLKALDVPTRINADLNSLGWTQEDLKPFKENLKKSISQTAYIMQTLRSNMGDVHGTKPTLRDLVFNSIKWAELIVRLLRDED